MRSLPGAERSAGAIDEQGSRSARLAVPLLYAALIGSAFIADLLTDRSFGASMASVLPVSFIALACMLVGPWLSQQGAARARLNWFIGATIVLFISMGFARLGPDQAKDGELVFTYALLILAFPASFTLPLAMIATDRWVGGNVFARMAVAWLACVGSGWIEWTALQYFCNAIRRRMKRPPHGG